MITHSQELETLRERVEVLEFELAEFKNQNRSAATALADEFGLSRILSQILAQLSNGRLVDKAYLAEFCKLKDEIEVKSIDVQLVKLRRRIHPIQIETVWGRGVRLTGENLSAIKSVIAGAA